MENKKLINIKVYSYKNSFNMPSNEGDAGHDLRYYGEAFTLKKHSIKKIRLQIRSILPKEYYVELAAKSGLASKGITTIGNIIDSGYTGYWHVILVNCSDEDYIFNDGDKVCQALIRQHNNIKLNLVSENKIDTVVMLNYFKKFDVIIILIDTNNLLEYTCEKNIDFEKIKQCNTLYSVYFNDIKINNFIYINRNIYNTKEKMFKHIDNIMEVFNDLL